MKGVSGSGVIAPLILAAIYIKRPASLPAVLLPRKEPPVATMQEFGWVCEVVRFQSTQESNLT